MRKFKKVLALTLALVMVLSCLSGVSAAGREKVKIDAAQTLETSAKEKGALSRDFLQNNSYKYADSDIVTAIVVLESAPEADFQGNESEKSAYRVKLTNEHNAVRKAMAMPYTMGYEYTALLNGFSCDVAYGDLEKIAEIEGVASVHIANSFAEPKLEKPMNNVSGQLNGNLIMNRSGFTGKGIVVAVLDTGLNITHEAFRVYDSMELQETLTEDSLAFTVAPGKYLSAKVPFSYDYAEKDNDVTDYNGHGTHVSGTAVGYAVSEEGVEIMRGGAPAAQLVSMKIFKDAGGGTRSDIYFYALEDAYRLGVDVVNMSIGAQNGFTYDESLETEIFGNIYKRMEAAGIVLCVAAGNEYSMAEYSSLQINQVGYVGSEYPDFGTVASPSTYEGAISIASMENYLYPDFVISVGGETISFIDSCTDEEHGWFDNFADTSVELVVLKNAEGTDLALGAVEDYEGIDVTDKIVVVSRGELSFQEKMDFAAAAGAAGIIVANNDVGRISMSIDPFSIPAISVEQSAREIFMACEAGDTLYTPTGKELVPNPNGLLMSTFSNWGTSPMLTIDPMITSIGGLVYSAVPGADDAYEVYSGTSMACPNAAGTFACVLQALNEEGYAMDEFGEWQTLTKAQRLDRASDLLASTGIILDDGKYIYSVRKQGAGLANSADATGLYLNGAYVTNPIQELGDDKEKTGVYTMDIELNNESLSDITYTDLGAYILMDNVGNTGSFFVNMQNSGLIYAGNDGYATVTFAIDGEEINEVTVLSGEKVVVSVTIELSDDIKAIYEQRFPNGTFVEGYVWFGTESEDELAETYETHATFLAFYGDWNQAPALEEANSFDFINALAELGKGGDVNAMPDEEFSALASAALSKVMSEKRYYTDINWVYTANSQDKLNNYMGANYLNWLEGPVNPANLTFSTPKTDGTWNYAVKMEIVPNLLRNARHIVMTVADKATGEVYMYDDTEFIPKDSFDAVETMAWQNYSLFAWDGTKADGETYVPSGTVATVTFDIQLPYGEADDVWQEAAWTFDVTVDYTAPVLESVVYDEEAKTITVKATDENYLAGIYVCSMDYATIYETKSIAPAAAGESFEAVFDVSELDADAVIVTAMDYATNENEQIVYFFEEGVDATLTLVTPEGEITEACVTGDEIKLPEAPSYDDYTFTAWVPAEVAQSNGSDLEEFYFADDWYMITEPNAVLYALYAKGTTVEFEKNTFILNMEDFGEGYWAFVGWPYVDDDFDYTDPYAFDANLGATQITALEDGEVMVDDYGFSTDDMNIVFYAQYFEDYDAYALINANSNQVLLDLNGELMFYDELYLEGLWTIENDGGQLYVYNYNAPTHVLLFNDEEMQFQVFDDTVPVDGDTTASGYFNLFPYEYTASKQYIEYYTTEVFIPENQTIILFTNDVHTYINNDGLRYSNVAALKADLIAKGNEVILVDAGDHVQGTAYGSMDKGETIIKLMSEAGYDAATLGNHEFDYGMARALELIDKAAYPYLSANFYNEKDGVRGENVLDSYKIFEMGGKKIAMIGVTTPETFTKSTPAYFMDENGNYIYGIAGGEDGAALYADVQAAIDAAKAEGADYIIGLGHLGDDPASDPWNSEDVISNVTGLDAFIDGHSHSNVERKEVADKEGNPVVLTQTGEYLNAIGKMTISEDGIAVELITEYANADEEVKAIEDAWAAEVDTLLGEVIAKNEVDFRIKDDEGTRLIRSQETNLGDFAADALYYLFDVTEGLGVDVAIMNGGGIRADMPAGDVSYKTTKTVHTFGNVACLIEVTGQQILDALEWGAKNVGVGENGGFLHVSGVTYEIHSYIPSTVQADDKGVWAGAPTGEYRVKNVTIGGEPLDVTKTYKMAGYNYTLRDLGDGFAMFDGAVNVKDYVMEDYMVLANYAKSFPEATIKADNSVLGANYGDINGEGRITIVTEEPEVVLPFEDVVESAWYYEGVKFMYANGLMNGVSETEFAPMGKVTRAMMVTVLWRAAGCPEAKAAATFTDVAADAWYADAVAWAQEEGIVLGVTEELFAPEKNVTREQIATILWRACGEEKVEIELTFTDAETVSAWAQDAMNWAVANGIFEGDSKGNLNPTATATRAQLAVIMARFLG